MLDLMVAPSSPARGRVRRVPGERTIRVKVSLAESELVRLRALAEQNFTTISEFLRDAANDAAEECGAELPFSERRGHERRTRHEPIAVERRRGDRRAR